MKKAMPICWLLLCLIIVSCSTYIQRESSQATNTSQDTSSANADIYAPSAKILAPVPTNKKKYIETYTAFLLDPNIEADNDAGFPIRGYYLLDLDFDDIPELGILHDSLGSMGGYFTYYRFNGDSIVPILDSENSLARCSNYTQVLADSENKKVYLLKEMYLLQGNYNGTYGYLKELAIQDGVPYVRSVLDLKVNLEGDLEKYLVKSYYNEDEFLSDAELDECLITQRYAHGEWKDISAIEYLKYKKELIPADSTFLDLRYTDISYIGKAEDMIGNSDWSLRG